MHPSTRAAGLALLTLLAITLAETAAQASTTRECYPAAYDADGDGYAREGAPTLPVSAGINCPSGYRRFAADCDDGNAYVHPRASEVPGNRVDDNCSGSADETQFAYSDARTRVTESAVTVVAELNDGAALSRRAQLYAYVEYAKLAKALPAAAADSYHDAFATTASGYAFVAGKVESTWNQVSFHVSGLDASTVYVIRLQTLYALDPGAGWITLPTRAEDFVTATGGTTWEANKRTDIVLRALEQLDESNRGRVGYVGTPAVDGTRFRASRGEKWCSEFYSWAAGTSMRDMYAGDYGALTGYFSGKADGWTKTASTIASRAVLGDWLAVDSDMDGDVNHSAMVLAKDPAGNVWTVEGNTGNQVGIRNRTIGVEIKGLGHVTKAMMR